MYIVQLYVGLQYYRRHPPVHNQDYTYKAANILISKHLERCCLYTKHYNTSCCQLVVLVFNVSDLQMTSLYVVTQSVRLLLELIIVNCQVSGQIVLTNV